MRGFFSLLFTLTLSLSSQGRGTVDGIFVVMRRKFDPSRKALLDSQERRHTFPPERLLSSLPLAPGHTVADIGCGIGYFTFPLAERLPQGRVYAADLSEEMLDVVREKLAKSPLNNISVVKSEEEKIPIPAQRLDGALLVCVLHEAAQDREAFLNLVAGLIKPGGWLAVVEWVKREMEVGPPLEERLDISETIMMIEKARLNLISQQYINDKFYFLLLRK